MRQYVALTLAVATTVAAVPYAAAAPKLDCTITKHHMTLDLAEQLCTADRDKDGSIDYAVKNIFDQDGHLIRREIDRNYDGSTDSVSTWAYNRLKQKIRLEQDRNADGSPELVCIWEYDHFERKKKKSCDRGYDGIDEIITWKYDAITGTVTKTRTDGFGSILEASIRQGKKSVAYAKKE